MIKTFPIGAKVFCFEDSIRGKREIKEGVVYGSYISRKTGDLYYYLKDKQYPAYCVGETEEEAEKLMAAFDAYCADYAERIDEQTEKFNKFKEAFFCAELKDESTEE